MFKRNNSKVLSLFVCLVVVASFLSYICINVDATGNIQDTVWSYSGTSKYTTTDPRTKMDYTSSYVYNDNSTCDIDQVRVFGDVIYNEAVVDYMDCTCYSCGYPLDLPLGYARYYPNFVKENGFNYAQINLFVNSSSYKYIHVLWSPDSV